MNKEKYSWFNTTCIAVTIQAQKYKIVPMNQADYSFDIHCHREYTSSESFRALTGRGVS